MRRSTLSSMLSPWPVLVLALILGTACNSADTTVPAVSVIPAGTNQAALVNTDGKGAGGLSVSPKTVPEGGFAADIVVHVVNGRPSTTYTVQRAPEIGRVLGADGSCQRALGLAPWSPSDPAAAAFLTFVPTGGSTPVTVTTSSTGEGTVQFDFRAPTIPVGTRFDVMFRLLDDLSAPTSVLLSSCFTVTVI
ncbi:MAG: hypothetical protein ABJC26_15335 [Gemmatimonadaceae bacterium]